MTKNKRIFLNIIATYGRNVYATLIGLFSSRWALMSLGAVDYGLYGVICGMTLFISVTNSLLAHVVGRYYALSIGKSSVAENSLAGLEECRRWFSIAVMIHSVVPVTLMFLGYPIGVWAIENFLTIPDDRVSSCIWSFRFVCVSCFFSMVTVPFMAMYRAKQYIAELTVYSIATSTMNVILLYYMVTHPSDWLAKYAAFTCLFAVLPQTVIMLRAISSFSECRFMFSYCRDMSRLRQFVKFAGWQAFGIFGGMLRSPGIALVVNKFYGPNVNASMTIANSVNGHANGLSSSLVNAFTPEIVSARGAGDIERMRTMAFRASKFGLLLALLFVIPLSVELRYVMHLWLGNPPAHAVGLCWCIMVAFLVDKSSVGQMIAVNAQDKIALYQAVLGTSLLLTIPLALLFVASGLGVYSVGWAFIITTSITAWGRVWFARRLAFMSARYWLFRIFTPIVLIALFSLVAGVCVGNFMEASFLRVCVTTLTCETILVGAGWFVVLSRDERCFATEKMMQVLRRIAPLEHV